MGIEAEEDGYTASIPIGYCLILRLVFYEVGVSERQKQT